MSDHPAWPHVCTNPDHKGELECTTEGHIRHPGETDEQSHEPWQWFCHDCGMKGGKGLRLNSDHGVIESSKYKEAFDTYIRRGMPNLSDSQREVLAQGIDWYQVDTSRVGGGPEVQETWLERFKRIYNI